MPADWYYQLQGFELGPVPLAEMRRLIQKGRITPGTFVRQGGGGWVHAEKAEALREGEAAAGDEATAGPPRWYVGLLGKPAAFGIPLGAALLPWHRLSTAAGLLILTPFAVASVRLLRDVALDVKANREKVEAG
jgi:hypothetical protein